MSSPPLVTEIPDADGGLWLDVGGVIGSVAPHELSLADGESAQDRYAVGDTVHDLFVWQINRGRPRVSTSPSGATRPATLRRSTAHSVGDVVSATVTVLAELTADSGLTLTV